MEVIGNRRLMRLCDYKGRPLFTSFGCFPNSTTSVYGFRTQHMAGEQFINIRANENRMVIGTDFALMYQ